ncbi:MAG: aminopeptidase, partial [bacterium]|nr:aminopeptidase [bacterium]
AEKNRQVKARCRALNELEITTIEVSGGKTDLRVGLSRHARWEGGSQETIPGQLFYPNIPSEEVFTTPDRRRTQGRLAATMPFRTESGLLVRNLVLQFRDGGVVAFDAKEGREGFARWLDTDEGARYLGEFALVGQDSPIVQSGRFFDLRVYDENASSHVALGQAWEFGFAGAESMPPGELEEMGFNHSAIHTDIMFGSTEVNIVATESREGEVIIIDRGNWTERFSSETSVAP